MCSSSAVRGYQDYQLCAGASPTAGDQGEGERADSVLSETERGPEGHQSQISGKGAVVTFFQNKYFPIVSLLPK